VEKVLYTEKTVWNDEYGLAGTIDLIYVHKKTKLIHLADYKTGQIKDITKLQLAIYKYMAEAQLGISVEQREVIPLPRKDKTSKIREYSNDTYQQDKEAFFGLLTYYQWKNKGEK